MSQDNLTADPLRTPLRRLERPSVGNKLARLLWRICYFFFFRFTPVPLHGWRRLVLRLFGARVGRAVVIYPSMRVWAPWNLEIEDGATIGWDCELYNIAAVHIGRNAIISQRTHLCTATHDIQSDFQLMAAPISIGEQAWIAAEAFLGPGVRIGKGAVLGARGVAIRSVAEWSIVAGNPAKHIGNREKTAKNSLHVHPRTF